jgi:hypothetical protein
MGKLQPLQEIILPPTPTRLTDIQSQAHPLQVVKSGTDNFVQLFKAVQQKFQPLASLNVAIVYLKEPGVYNVDSCDCTRVGTMPQIWDYPFREGVATWLTLEM